MKVLGIDPGYERVGISVLGKEDNQKEILFYSTCFKTPKELDFTERLELISKKIEEVIKNLSQRLCQ